VNEFEKRAEIVRKFVEQRRSAVNRAYEVMHSVRAEHAEHKRESVAGKPMRAGYCHNCEALMLVIDELLSPEHKGNA
jgi:hypothetical protein